MKGDFTRLTHDPAKHYIEVHKQQGRVDLDADWNEAAAIQSYLRHTQAQDLIGSDGVPTTGGGFEIVAVSAQNGEVDLEISPGRIYVGGVLCELATAATYRNQPDYPNPPPIEQPVAGRTDLVYLDLWQRHVTALEDPDIREVALGGPDTTTRLKTVCQIKVRAGDLTSSNQTPDLPQASNNGALSTGVTPSRQSEGQT